MEMNQIMTNAKSMNQETMNENIINLLKEDIECVHLFLDDYDIPRADKNGILSMIGRIKKLVEKADGTFFG